MELGSLCVCVCGEDKRIAKVGNTHILSRFGSKGGLWERDLNFNGMWAYTTRVGTGEVRHARLFLQLLQSWMLLLLKPFRWPPSMHLLRGSYRAPV